MNEIKQRMKRLLSVLVDEAERNPLFEAQLAAVLGIRSAAPELTASPQESVRRGGRRAPPALDPFLAFGDGEEKLRHCLAALSLEQLRDIIADHAMDPSKLAMKWKDPTRVIDHIVVTVASRAKKGTAFLNPPSKRLGDDRTTQDSQGGTQNDSRQAPSDVEGSRLKTEPLLKDPKAVEED